MISSETQKPSSPLGRLYRKLSPKRTPPSHNSLSLKSPTDTNMLQRVFEYFDKNGDGKISAAELQSCVGNLSKEEAEVAVRSSDTDGDGLLGFEDFQGLMTESSCSNSGNSSSSSYEDDGLKEAFKMYETEPGSGFITPCSLKRMLNKLGDNSSSVEDCKSMIRAYDLNGDGILNFHEFSVMMHC